MLSHLSDAMKIQTAGKPVVSEPISWPEPVAVLTCASRRSWPARLRVSMDAPKLSKRCSLGAIVIRRETLDDTWRDGTRYSVTCYLR